MLPKLIKNQGLRSKVKFLIPILIVLGLFVVFTNPNFFSNSQTQTEFVKRCKELNGKAFTYENLLTLNGYIGLAENKYEGDRYVSGSFGHYPFEKQYFDKYLTGEFLVNDGRSRLKNTKLIMVSPTDYSFSIAEDQGVEGIWSCKIKPDANNSSMTTTPYWLQVY